MGLDAVVASLGDGRLTKNEPLAAEVERPITAEDLVAMAERGRVGSVPTIKELRTHHHALARSLAGGMKNIDASLKHGVTPERISQLQSDPQFVQLLNHYKSMEAKEFANLHAMMFERLQELGFSSIESLHDKVLAGEVKDAVLVKIAELTLNRTGHGPTAKVDHEHSHFIDEAQLARIREMPDAPARLAEEDRGALVRLALRATSQHTEFEEATWSEGEGADLRDQGGQRAEAESQGE